MNRETGQGMDMEMRMDKQELYQEPVIESIQTQRTIFTEVLDHLKRPEKVNYGLDNFESFYRNVKDHLFEGRPTVIFIAGKPLSGKTIIESQLTELLQNDIKKKGVEKKLTILRWAQAVLAVGGDDPQVFGRLGEEGFKTASRLMSSAIDRALSRGDVVIAEVVPVTAISDSDGSMRGIDRGWSTVRQFVSDANAFVISPFIQENNRSNLIVFREAAARVKTIDDMVGLFERFNVELCYRDQERLHQLLKELPKLGATPFAIREIDKQVNEIMVYLINNNRMPLPDHIAFYGVRRPVVEDMFERASNQVITMVYNQCFLPYLMKEEFRVPENRLLIGGNQKLETVHFHLDELIGGRYSNHFLT